jgi:hypothetical protein
MGRFENNPAFTAKLQAFDQLLITAFFPQLKNPVNS